MKLHIYKEISIPFQCINCGNMDICMSFFRINLSLKSQFKMIPNLSLKNKIFEQLHNYILSL